MQITDLNISTRQVRAFLALAQHRNFTRAAQQSHLSQSAFSTMIRTLEDAVGLRLFDRDTRKVDLTPEGELFRQGVSRLMEDFRATMADLGEHAARRRGRARIAALPSLAAGWLPGLLAEFHRKHPGIALEVSDELSEECIERVRAGQADFALAAIRSTSPELRADPFCSDRFHLVCRRDHPLAARKRIALQDLAGVPFLHLARNSSVRQHLEAALGTQAMQAEMELEQLSTVAGMVRAGLGVSVVPTLALFHFEHPDLVTRPVSSPGLRRELFVVRRKDRSLSLAAQAVLDHLLAHRPKGVAR
ncbi:LysR family transcriptional regulator [Ramlibacter sp. MMS24-I3-19]|uniref:LysR family transcriptional regulator n=1 Tax=Ramlibacter sp. MMS24-I3-19 TaxID=3416606 RepID=UPI003D06F660